jgi:hypothetical protein
MRTLLGQFGFASDFVSALVSGNALILLDFVGTTRRIQTDDLLITNRIY